MCGIGTLRQNLRPGTFTVCFVCTGCPDMFVGTIIQFVSFFPDSETPPVRTGMPRITVFGWQPDGLNRAEMPKSNLKSPN